MMRKSYRSGAILRGYVRRDNVFTDALLAAMFGRNSTQGSSNRSSIQYRIFFQTLGKRFARRQSGGNTYTSSRVNESQWIDGMGYDLLQYRQRL